MKQFSFYIVIILSLSFLLRNGCDIAINPLLFNGSPITAEFVIDEQVTTYNETDQIRLSNILSSISEKVDSIKVFNVTLRIEPMTGTPANLTVSGSLSIDNQGMVVLSNLPVSMYQNEQSIFDFGVTQYLTVDPGMIAFLNSLLAQSTLPAVTVNVSGQASETPVRLRIFITLYTQVYTS
jgi:hypothetical protein